ncbi:hypothetical protein Mapa_000975 [Marchantia paleacea]|nr:hypothetical protein Mapa_000975 [Marchantia paleacea]
MGRDAPVRDNPLVFKPERFLDSSIDVKGQHFQLLPFGSGKRICAGVNLSLLILQQTVAQVLHCCELSLPSGYCPDDVDLEEMFGGTTSRKARLEVCASPRLPAHVNNYGA